VMGMLVATLIAIATFHVHTKKKEKMKEWEERKKKEGAWTSLCVFFLHTTNYGVHRPPFGFNSLRSFIWKSNSKITKFSNKTIICLLVITRM
jgi:hypothetical protein